MAVQVPYTKHILSQGARTLSRLLSAEYNILVRGDCCRLEETQSLLSVLKEGSKVMLVRINIFLRYRDKTFQFVLKKNASCELSYRFRDNLDTRRLLMQVERKLQSPKYSGFAHFEEQTLKRTLNVFEMNLKYNSPKSTNYLPAVTTDSSYDFKGLFHCFSSRWRDYSNHTASSSFRMDEHYRVHSSFCAAR